MVDFRRGSLKQRREPGPKRRSEDQQADQDRAGSCNQHGCRADIFSNPGQLVLLVAAGQIHNSFQRGVDKFGRPDHGDADDDHSPVMRGKLKPEGNALFSLSFFFKVFHRPSNILCKISSHERFYGNNRNKDNALG